LIIYCELTSGLFAGNQQPARSEKAGRAFAFWGHEMTNFNNVVVDTIKAGVTTLTAAIFAVLKILSDAFGTVSFDRGTKTARIPLTAADTGGGLFAWQNPEAGAILIKRILTNGACTADIGTTTVDATTSSDNLIDGISLASSAKVVDNLDDTDNGTNGKTKQKLAAGKWVTGSAASGASAGLVGFAYIEYINV
jgi:hypothetical protein